jgi:hypothetical protein
MIRCAVAREGRPLDSPLREFFESRFRTSLVHIRIHTDAHAAAAAACLNARAFAWGRHIVFAAGQYQPGTTTGMRLLAHELTHAIQNQDEPTDGQPIRLGSPDDPLEREADLLADCIGSSAPLPAITRGEAVLRRVIITKAPATVRIEVIDSRALPEPSTEVGASRDMFSFNLRSGFNPANPAQSGGAFDLKGHVGVTLEPTDPRGDFTFGFIQFMRQIDWSFVFAGREDREGMIRINPMPQMGSNFLLDVDRPAGAAFSPFAQNPNLNTTFDPAVSEDLVTVMSDHPQFAFPQRLINETTRQTNFIFSYVDHREAVSVFVVRDRRARGGREFVPLAHVHWDLFYSGTFKWRDRHCLPATNLSSIKFDQPIKGDPTDKRIATLLASVTPTTAPDFNGQGNRAFRVAATSPNSRELDHYEGSVPPCSSWREPGRWIFPETGPQASTPQRARTPCRITVHARAAAEWVATVRRPAGAARTTGTAYHAPASRPALRPPP